MGNDSRRGKKLRCSSPSKRISPVFERRRPTSGLQYRRFAGAVGPNDGDDLAGFDLEAHITKRMDIPIANVDLLYV